MHNFLFKNSLLKMEKNNEKEIREKATVVSLLIDNITCQKNWNIKYFKKRRKHWKAKVKKNLTLKPLREICYARARVNMNLSGQDLEIRRTKL